MSNSAAGAREQACPRCGQAASGRFCSDCGAALSGATCRSCKAPLSPGAKFCHLCGAPLGAARRPSSSRAWLAAGLATTAVVTLLVILAVRGPGAVPAAAGPPVAGAATGGEGAAVDIANMSPRDRADRLYDRIMRAHERGDTTEINFFKPMALQAYAMLGELDNDARYHVGLIHALTGSPEAARAQADSMDAGNLMAAMLRQRVAMGLGETEASLQAYRDFMATYEREIAEQRPEYEAHRPLLESFLAEARRATGSGSDS